MNDIVVVKDNLLDTPLAGIPTPALMQAGRGEAYFVPSQSGSIPGIWYLRDDAHGYVSPTGEYVRVRVLVRGY